MSKQGRLPKFTRVRFVERAPDETRPNELLESREGVIVKAGRRSFLSTQPSSSTIGEDKIKAFAYTIQCVENAWIGDDNTQLVDKYTVPEGVIEVLGEVDPSTLLADQGRGNEPIGCHEARLETLRKMLKECPVYRCKLNAESGRTEGRYAIVGVRGSASYCGMANMPLVCLENIDVEESLVLPIAHVLWDSLRPMKSSEELLTTGSRTAQRAAFDKNAIRYTTAANAVKKTFKHLNDSFGRLRTHLKRLIERKRLLGNKLGANDPKRIAAYTLLDESDLPADLVTLETMQDKYIALVEQLKENLLRVEKE